MDGVTKVVPITLTKVLLAVLIAIITFVGARNLPGVLEITLLKYIPLDAGARYAFSTICQYVVSGIGVIVAFNYLGIDWGSLKWLVAALGVGIGFGMQAIVNNFVSGLILLFERPIRVGDTVDLDRDAERKRRRRHGGAGMLARLAQRLAQPADRSALVVLGEPDLLAPP